MERGIFLMQFILGDTKSDWRISNVLSEEDPTVSAPRANTHASLHRKLRSDRAATVLLCSMLDSYGSSQHGVTYAAGADHCRIPRKSGRPYLQVL